MPGWDRRLTLTGYSWDIMGIIGRQWNLGSGAFSIPYAADRCD